MTEVFHVVPASTCRVLYVPTRAGYSLLLSVDRWTEFVERLRTLAPAT